ILACFRCHSDRDWSQPGGPVPNEKKGAGHVFEKENIPGLVAPNITPDLETGAGKWTDDMLARAIRQGVGHEGRGLHPQLWSRAFERLSYEDVASAGVSLRVIQAIGHPLPQTSRARSN